MRGAGTLKAPLPVAVRTEAEAAVALGLANNTQELQDTWFLCAEPFEGDARKRLQDAYTRQLRLMGALHG